MLTALPTQFDQSRLGATVATPTCSSCCCCCCCLATTIASSSLLAQRVNKEAKARSIKSRPLLTTIAALFVPVVGVVLYFAFWTLNRLNPNCAVISQYGEKYRYCASPGSTTILVLIVGAPALVLWFLYSRVRIAKPVARAFKVSLLILVAFVAELFGGGALILTGVGGIVYLILIPIIVGWISVWYRRHLVVEDTTGVEPSAVVAEVPSRLSPVHVAEPVTPTFTPMEPTHDEIPRYEPPPPVA